VIPAEPVLPPMKVLQIILNTHAGDTCQALETAFKSHSAECQLSLITCPLQARSRRANPSAGDPR
jgi:hypothetical protein